MGTYLTIDRKLLIYLAMLTAAPLAAQSALGIVTGTVQDASQAAVPNAIVTITGTATGAAHTSQSNTAGVFYIGSLQLGPYHISVQAPGFQTWETDFTLQAGQTLKVNPALTVGAVQSKVDVTGAAPLVQTEGAQLSDIKTAKEIHDLPLNGRQISNLFTLTPGVEGGQNQKGATTPRTNGMVVGSTEISLDGMSYVDRFGGGISQVQPGLDTVQEYRIDTAGSGAAYDRPAAIELVTRSGTNQFHGAAFETLRDNYGGLVARAIQDPGGAPPKLIRNEFGGFIGGPIKRNKTFFFYDQELLKQRQEVFGATSVPTAANWAGDLSNITDSNNNNYTIYDPFSTDINRLRKPLPGKIIPSSRFDVPLINALEAITPKPAGPHANVNPWLGNNFQTYYPQNTNTNSITGRIDQIFSERDNLSVRYTGSTYNYLQAGGYAGYPAPGVTNATGTAQRKSDIYNMTAHYTHTFSPVIINDLQLGTMISMNHAGTNADSTQWSDKLGFPNPWGAPGWPTISISDPFEGGAWDSDNQKRQNETQYDVDDNVAWVHGKHTFKFGGKFRLEQNNIEELQQPQGSESFDNTWTGLYDSVGQQQVAFTGAGLASLEMGLPSYLSNHYNRGYFYFRQKEIALFGEDTWKLTPKLTVSAGLRWGFWTPYHEKYNRLLNVNLSQVISDPTSMQVVLPQYTTLDTVPGVPADLLQAWKARGLTGVSANSSGFASALIPSVWNDFAPRAAVAYSITPKWVVRGGYGIYYFPMPLVQLLQTARNNPPLDLRYENSVSSQQNLNGNYSLMVKPTQSDMLSGVGGTATIFATAPNGARSFIAMDPNGWNDNRVQEWTFSIERQLWSDMVLKLAYTGNHGSNLMQNWDYNGPLSRYNYQLLNGVQAPVNSYLRQINPNWSMSGTNGVLRHNGYSNGQGIQVDLTKRFSRGLSFSFFYAYTHTMDTNDPDGFSYPGASGINGVSSGGALSGSVPDNNEILNAPHLTDSQRLRFLYTNSGQVPPQRITWSGLWELPFGRNKRYLANANRALDALVGGWQISFIGTWDGGFWMGNDPGQYQFRNPSVAADKRLNLALVDPATGNGTPEKLWFAGYFDPTSTTGVNLSQLEALVPADAGARAIHPLGSNFDNRISQTVGGKVIPTNIGDMLSWNARNYMLGPAAWNQDVSLFKYFSFTERVRLRMSGDFFNAFNHPLLNTPNSTTGLIDLTSQPNSPRIIQIGARLEF